MNGELAQSLAIATHVSLWLAESRDDRSGVPEFADLVAFDSVVGFDAWAERLAGDGVDRLWLAVTDLEEVDPVMVGFAGGLPVGLLDTGSAGGRLWRPRWGTHTRVSDGGEILVANYLSEPVAAEPPRVAVGAAREELDGVLRRAGGFAERQQLPTWAKVFAEARRPAAAEVFPAAWPDADGARLAGMALAAWVFGGMGSWNDLGFDGGAVRAEYEQISRELLGAVLRACVAAVNTDLG